MLEYRVPENTNPSLEILSLHLEIAGLAVMVDSRSSEGPPLTQGGNPIGRNRQGYIWLVKLG